MTMKRDFSLANQYCVTESHAVLCTYRYKGKKKTMKRVKDRDVHNNIVKCLLACLSALHSENEFMKVRWDLPVHSFEVLIPFLPHPFNMISCGVISWVHKMILMVHSLFCG